MNCRMLWVDATNGSNVHEMTQVEDRLRCLPRVIYRVAIAVMQVVLLPLP